MFGRRANWSAVALMNYCDIQKVNTVCAYLVANVKSIQDLLKEYPKDKKIRTFPNWNR